MFTYLRSGHCSYDYLAIQEPVPRSNDKIELEDLGRYCGDNIPGLVTSSQINGLKVRMPFSTLSFFKHN